MPKGWDQRIWGEMDAAVERDHPAQAGLGHVRDAQIALAEGERRVALGGLRHHPARIIDALDRHPGVGQEGGHMTRAAAQIGHRAERTHLLGEGQEQRPVERLTRQFIGDVGRIVGRHPVIAGLEGVGHHQRILWHPRRARRATAISGRAGG